MTMVWKIAVFALCLSQAFAYNCSDDVLTKLETVLKSEKLCASQNAYKAVEILQHVINCGIKFQFNQLLRFLRNLELLSMKWGELDTCIDVASDYVKEEITAIVDVYVKRYTDPYINPLIVKVNAAKTKFYRESAMPKLNKTAVGLERFNRWSINPYKSPKKMADLQEAKSTVPPKTSWWG